MNDTTTPVDERREPADAEPTRGRRSTGRRISFWTGMLLMVVGVSLLGYVAWQYYGTNILSKREHAAIREDLREDWAQGDAVTGGDAGALGTADALIRIPRFGDDFEVPVIEGVRDEDLSRGIGHFPFSAGPGEIGNYALAGHRVTHGEPFNDLPELRPGDEVIVETADATYIYVLDTDPNDLVIPFTDGWVVADVPIPPPGEVPPGMPVLDPDRATERIITLTTCSELFHTDDRMVAFGHLDRTVAKP